ncbi:MAG: hypothetical protein JKY27_05965 [Magnetovibrio sp.]|nr:hypothetical protein [Magnetovibrio sp.]
MQLDIGDHNFKNRHAVIASGSNASPNRLAAKFSNHGHLLDDALFVTRATLHDFDAVYSAHISNYGSIPATLAHTPGTDADVFVTWLTDAQLERMHTTEAVGENYDYARLNGISLVLEDGSGYTQAHAYMSKRGCLSHDGRPIALAALNATGRMWCAMSQTEVLDHARSLIAPELDANNFIQSHIECANTRQARTAILSKTALHHGWTGGFTVLS